MLRLVTDEQAVCESLTWLRRSRAMAVACYESTEAFLAALNQTRAGDPHGECVLLDIRMPNISGIELFDELAVYMSIW
jgi:two-component system response regulator DctR